MMRRNNPDIYKIVLKRNMVLIQPYDLLNVDLKLTSPYAEDWMQVFCVDADGYLTKQFDDDEIIDGKSVLRVNAKLALKIYERVKKIGPENILGAEHISNEIFKQDSNIEGQL